MRPLFSVVVLLLAVASPVARAEFLIATPARASAEPPRQTTQSPPANLGPVPALPSTPARPLVRGFGTQIPLSFAVRQIVPVAFTVSYGAGVDPTVLVSWRGNRPWRRALRNAVAPLGLRLVAGAHEITITYW
jgi:hypothetical protein